MRDNNMMQSDLMNQDQNRWHVGLPSDFQRAGPEIYRSMRSSGAASTRDWLQANYSGLKGAGVWTDLWTAATSVDYKLSTAATQSDLLTILSTDDGVEMHLRRLASFVYERRTRDKTGAAHMLAITPPGLETDVAPTWLVSTATAHSKNEHMRDERVKVSEKKSSYDGGGKGDGKKPKGKGKGKGKKGKAGDGAGGAPQG
jgi:hypothetical protein